MRQRWWDTRTRLFCFAAAYVLGLVMVYLVMNATGLTWRESIEQIASQPPQPGFLNRLWQSVSATPAIVVVTGGLIIYAVRMMAIAYRER